MTHSFKEKREVTDSEGVLHVFYYFDSLDNYKRFHEDQSKSWDQSKRCGFFSDIWQGLDGTRINGPPSICVEVRTMMSMHCTR